MSSSRPAGRLRPGDLIVVPSGRVAAVTDRPCWGWAPSRLAVVCWQTLPVAGESVTQGVTVLPRAEAVPLASSLGAALESWPDTAALPLPPPAPRHAAPRSRGAWTAMLLAAVTGLAARPVGARCRY